MDYVQFFGGYATVDPLGLITLFFLTLFRLGPIVHLAPFFGAKIAPAVVRVGIMVSLAVIFMPLIGMEQHEGLAFNLKFAGYAFKELLIGFVLGLLISIPFQLIESSGVVIDYMRGSGVLMGQNPLQGSQASPIGIMLNYLLIVMFFQLNGPFLFLDIVSKSYALLPADGTISPQFLNLNAPFWKLGLGLLSHIMTLALELVAPTLVAVLMAEVFLGIANRLAPQVQIAFLGMALKSLLGLFVFFAGWFLILRTVGNHTLDWIHTMDKLVDGLRVYTLK